MSTKLSAVEAVAAVMADLSAVGKTNTANAGGKYRYRGIDDLINAMAGPMREHGLLLVPHVVESEVVPMASRSGWSETRVTVEYDVYGPDGSTLERPVRAFAIGHDNSDKGPGKAMSYAYKTAISQLLCVPTDDPAMDNEASHTPEPSPQDPRAVKIVTLMTDASDDIKTAWKKANGDNPHRITDSDALDRALAHAEALVAGGDFVQPVEPVTPAGPVDGDGNPIHPDQGTLEGAA